MQVVHRLTAVGTLVRHDAIPIGRLGAAAFARDAQQVGDLIRRRLSNEVPEVRGVALRNREEVRRRLRVGVVEHHHVFRAPDFIGGNLATEYSTEDTGLAHGLAFGFIVTKLNDVSGLAVTPATDDFAANETTECTSGTAGARSWIMALACW